jgi:hypothetical protein
MGKPDFVSLGIAIVIIHAMLRAADTQRHIAVAEQDTSSRDRIAASRDVGSVEGAVAQGTIISVLRYSLTHLLDVENARWEEMVIEDGLNTREPFQAHDFFTVEAIVRLAELDMAFGWDLAEVVVKGHRYSSNFSKEDVT